jgi:hypothetical protein
MWCAVIDKDALVQQRLELDMEIVAAETRRRSAERENPHWESRSSELSLGRTTDSNGETRSQRLQPLRAKPERLVQQIRSVLDAEDAGLRREGMVIPNANR